MKEKISLRINPKLLKEINKIIDYKEQKYPLANKETRTNLIEKSIVKYVHEYWIIEGINQ